jgi:hypothetical protein
MSENRQPEIPRRPQDAYPPFSPVGGTLTGDTLAVPREDVGAVQVFLAVLADDRDKAVRLVRKMSLRDKALLAFFVRELSGVVEEDMALRSFGV